MKKIVSGLLMLTLLFALSMPNVLAASPSSGRRCASVRTTRKCALADVTRQFIDANKDGICDNRVSDNYGGNNAGQNNFVDTNEDGVCDNYGTSNYQIRNCQIRARKGKCNR